ncbi:MAG: hypothetical protein Q7T50_05600, partial [Candidatus Magasanikbacteria bacterium]|nr:hypothetical protein [Candidatus Magasanikbacteria bacterium]
LLHEEEIGMTYQEIVVSNKEAIALTGYLKMAKDLAAILDSPELNCDIDKINSSTVELSINRERVFDRFCAICSKSGVKIPEYEPLFYMAPLYREKRLDQDSEKAFEKKLVKHVACQLKGKTSEETEKMKALLEILELFPSPGYGRIDDQKIYAMISFLLVQMGCEPLRPDYSQYPLRNFSVPETAIETKVLIVDDDKSEIMQTAMALAGWPKMIIDFYFHKSGYEKLEGQEKTEKLEKTAQAIILKSPDIILMDKSMGDIEGNELIFAIKAITGDRIIFVGNTGGSDNILREAGALENCRKGSEFRGLIQAIDILKFKKGI